VVFASHHWPTWGRERVVEFLSLQRDLYAYLHDQTLRLLNQGHTGAEIAEALQMPPAWRRPGIPTVLRFGQPQRQGDLPALHGLVRRQPCPPVAAPPEALASRYVEAIGGIDRVVALAQHAFDTVTSVGRQRCSIMRCSPTARTPVPAPSRDTLEQLAYGAENATWRNFFLSGTAELRDGNFGTRPNLLADVDVCADSGADLRRPGHQRERTRAWDLDLAIDVSLTDTDRNYRLALRNGVLVHREVPADPQPQR